MKYENLILSLNSNPEIRQSDSGHRCRKLEYFFYNKKTIGNAIDMKSNGGKNLNTRRWFTDNVVLFQFWSAIGQSEGEI